ncbi:MAG: hypothetical protein KatS3mg124_1397 [Porticoccaceae bacterium]|nr:MAG: hypothetical protein KatS3mg124_1397 [Porticoccaceae bacterium]
MARAVGRPLAVWVLAASTGGVEAAVRFLRRLPPTDRCALVYVQHLAPEQHPHLVAIVGRACRWPVSGVRYGAPLRGGTLLVPSADERFDIGEDGLLGLVGGEGWRPPWRPRIDEVAAQVAGRFGPNAGMVVLSGLAGDGLEGARRIVDAGGRLWVQSPASAAAPGMPESILAALPVERVGGVEELADAFAARYPCPAAELPGV